MYIIWWLSQKECFQLYDVSPQYQRWILVVWHLLTNILFHVVAVRQMAAKGQSDRKASDMEVRMKQNCVTEFLYAEKIAPTEQSKEQGVLFSSSDSDVKDKSCSGWSCRFLLVQHAVSCSLPAKRHS